MSGPTKFDTELVKVWRSVRIDIDLTWRVKVVVTKKLSSEIITPSTRKLGVVRTIPSEIYYVLIHPRGLILAS